MEQHEIPQVLYYATIECEDGLVESPHFTVFDNLQEGVKAVGEYCRDREFHVTSITMKEVVYVGTCVPSDECFVLIPHNDKGVDDDFRDPLEQAEMVEKAERAGNDHALMSVLPFEQDVEHILCRSYIMGPYMPARNADEFEILLEREPFVTSEPLDCLWLYKPTGAWHEYRNDQG